MGALVKHLTLEWRSIDRYDDSMRPSRRVEDKANHRPPVMRPATIQILWGRLGTRTQLIHYGASDIFPIQLHLPFSPVTPSFTLHGSARDLSHRSHSHRGHSNFFTRSLEGITLIR